MAINSTTNLGLALPDQGEWDGTWGTNTNNQITSLIDSAVAGTTTLSTDADVTLTDTTLAANQSRQAIILWTASNGATTRNVTAPARSKAYVVINAGTGSIVFRGAGPTAGVTIVSGERCSVAWNGTDFVKVGTFNGATSFTTLDVGTQNNKATISYTTNTARTLTIPSLSGNRTFSFIDQSQTFTAAQIFNAGAEVSRLTFTNTDSNIIIGGGVLASATGDDNVGAGESALGSVTSGTNNVGIGTQAGTLLTNGDYNTFVGSFAGYLSCETGNQNTVIGSFANTSSLSSSTEVVIGYSATGKGTNTAFIGGTNGAYNEKNVTTWETTSDERIKKNIVDNNDGLEKIKAIRVRNFEYRTKDEITELPQNAAVGRPGTQLGVIAQEMLPECVSTASTGVLSVNTDPLVWYLVNAVKQLSAQVDALTAEVQALKGTAG